MCLITKDGCTFFSERQIDTINRYGFLTDLYDNRLSNSAINTAKSIMSSVFEIIHKRNIGKEVLIRRFMKGIFHLRPAFPKTIFTWNVKVVLKFLRSLEDNNPENDFCEVSTVIDAYNRVTLPNNTCISNKEYGIW